MELPENEGKLLPDHPQATSQAGHHRPPQATTDRPPQATTGRSPQTGRHRPPDRPPQATTRRRRPPAAHHRPPQATTGRRRPPARGGPTIYGRIVGLVEPPRIVGPPPEAFPSGRPRPPARGGPTIDEAPMLRVE